MNRFFTAVTIVLGLIVQHPVFAAGPDCTKIIHVSNNSAEAKGIRNFIEQLVNQNEEEKSKVEFRTIEKVGTWLIVEADFTHGEPGIFVLEQTKKSYQVATEFGGYVQEEPEKTIRSYFLKKVPKAPKELFQCYTPKGAPFHRVGE